MEVVGYIIGGINLVVGIIITILRSIDDQWLNAESAMLEEYSLAYTEFGNIVSSEVTESEKLSRCVARLKRLHHASQGDFVKLNLMGWLLRVTLPLIIISIIVALISLLVGLFAVTPDHYSLKFSLIIIIPFIALVLELVVLLLIIRFERYLKRATLRYKNLDY
jgi:hypothetical protein